MKAVDAFYNILSNNAALVAAVGTNINPLRIVQGASYPGITYRVTSVRPHPSKSGHSKTDWCTLEVNIYAETFAQCYPIADLVRTALEVQTPGTFNGVYVWEVEYDGEGHFVDDNAEELGVYQISQNYTISYNR